MYTESVSKLLIGTVSQLQKQKKKENELGWVHGIMFHVVSLGLRVPRLVAACVTYQLRASTKSIFPLQLLPNKD